MRPRQGSVLAVCNSYGNKRVKRSPSVNLLVGVAAPSDPVESFLVKILHSVESGDVEQGCSNLEITLVFAIALSISHLYLYLACTYCSYLLLA